MIKTIFLFSVLITSHVCSAMEVDISGIDKKILLQALYTRAERQLMYGGLRVRPDYQLTDVEIQAALNQGFIGYITCKNLNIDISGDSMSTSSYNRINGKNAAETVVKELRDLNGQNTDEDQELPCVIQ
jgi:hypothetical protein